MASSEERAARNEVAFRDANERIARRRAELPTVEGPTPYLCECEDDACTEILMLTPAQYEQVRSRPDQFVLVPGHPTSGAETATSGDGWVCVRKTGRAAEVGRETDGRS